MELDDRRTRILQILYEEGAKSPSQTLDSDELARRMETSWEDIETEIAYLTEKELVFLKKRQIRARIFQSLYLTAKGIDLIETGETDVAGALRQELSRRYSNLHYLREQAATYGAGALPLHLHNQIELERQAIENLEDKLRKLAGK